MSAPKFTPGPWRVGQWLGGAWCVTSAPLSQPRGGEITSVVYGPLSGTPEGNARLIAAAPELLAALEAEQEWRDRDAAGALDPEWDYERMVGDKRRAALAKAEGRS